MKSRSLLLLVLLAIAAFAAAPLQAGPISRAEIKLQNENFKTWWDADLEWRFDELPLKGKVPSYRMPYAGYIYPDKTGGCEAVLRKYDRAFNWGRGSAAQYERHDIASTRDKVQRPGGLFGWRMVTRTDTPDWAGHCNGWVSAAIRHAEPQRSVVRNGVTFTPADIKALLAEVYVYNDVVSLGGEFEPAVNPATLHVVLGNWLGRGEHPVGMDSSVGKEVWNYPIYGYNAAAASRGDRRVEVRMNLGYVYMLDQEYHVAPKNNRVLSLHYMLYLDSQGRIIGGDYLRGSDRVAMLWTPRQLFPTRSTGNKSGNPYVNTDVVLAMWRESASPELRAKWWNIDPIDADRIREDEAPDYQAPAPEETLAEGSDSDPSESESAEEAAEFFIEEIADETEEAAVDDAPQWNSDDEFESFEAAREPQEERSLGRSRSRRRILRW